MKGKFLTMRKIISILLLYFCLGLAGCNSKEEAMAVITEIPCETAGVSFSLNGLWIIQEEAEANANAQTGQTVVLSTYKEESGSGVSVIYEDLTKTEGGTLVRLDDYVAGLQEQLKISEDYNYSCEEVSTEKLHGNSYETFKANIRKLGGTQQYYIRRQDDTMIIMIFTAFVEDTLEDVLSVVKPL